MKQAVMLQLRLSTAVCSAGELRGEIMLPQTFPIFPGKSMNSSSPAAVLPILNMADRRVCFPLPAVHIPVMPLLRFLCSAARIRIILPDIGTKENAMSCMLMGMFQQQESRMKEKISAISFGVMMPQEVYRCGNKEVIS